MKYITDKMKEAMKIYENENFYPDDVLSGVKWRKDAMEQWAANNPIGLTPVVTSEVPLDNNDTCISCGTYIDFSKDERKEDERSYKMNTCHECIAAISMISPSLWRNYKNQKEKNIGEGE